MQKLVDSLRGYPKNFCFMQLERFFSDFSREITEKALKLTKKIEKQLKKGFDQLLGASDCKLISGIYVLHFFGKLFLPISVTL